MAAIYALSIAHMKKVLLSGFGPFLEIKNNPSEQIVLKLAEDFQIPFIILPVVFAESFEVLKQKIQIEKPDVILMFGVAATRSTICFERIGLNWVDSKNADSKMVTPKTGRIDSKQELALMSPFNLEEVISQYDFNERKSLEISYSAGTYVCNDLYFRMLNEKQISADKLFIHIPSFDKIDEQLQLKLLSKVVQNAMA